MKALFLVDAVQASGAYWLLQHGPSNAAHGEVALWLTVRLKAVFYPEGSVHSKHGLLGLSTLIRSCKPGCLMPSSLGAWTLFRLGAGPAVRAGVHVRPQQRVRRHAPVAHRQQVVLDDAQKGLKTTAPHIPLLTALWALLCSIWGILQGSWGFATGTPDFLRQGSILGLGFVSTSFLLEARRLQTGSWNLLTHADEETEPDTIQA